MASIREQILAAMVAGLESISGPVVARDAALPEKVPVGGLVILRDNGEVPQAAFSGADQYELRVAIELFADTTDATTSLDALRTAAITTFLADRTVGGLAVDVREGPTSELDPLHAEGAAPIAARVVEFVVDYWTAEGDPDRIAP
jgi:hypothetical protein